AEGLSIAVSHSWNLLPSHLLSTGDAADEVRRRRPLLPRRHAPPPLRLHLLLLLLWAHPPSRRRCPLLHHHHHHQVRRLVPSSSFGRRQEQGVRCLGVGARAGGVHGFPRHAGAGDQDQGAAGGGHGHRRRHIWRRPPCLHRCSFQGIRREVCRKSAENGLQGYMGGAPKHRACCGPNDDQDAF
ncbi:Os06g0484600, partial [Oryza sativa Japonica Group]